jgi:hypothetical protein
MKKVLLLCIFSFFVLRCFPQNPGPNISWQKCFSTSKNDEVLCIKEHPKGGFLATMYFEAKDNFLSNDTSTGGYLIRFDNNFNIQWKMHIPFYATRIFVLQDNSLVLGGQVSKYLDKYELFDSLHTVDFYAPDVALMKLDSTGKNIIWAKAFGTNGEEYPSDIIMTSNGDFLISGDTNFQGGDLIPFPPCYNPFTRDAFIIKIDSLGKKKWVKVFTGTKNEKPIGSIIEVNSNKFVFDVFSNSDDCDFDSTKPMDFDSLNYRILTVALDSNGNQLLHQLDESGRNFHWLNKSIYRNGKYYKVGNIDAKLSSNPTFPYHNEREGRIGIFDSNFNCIFAKSFGSSNNDFFTDFNIDEYGNFYFLGETNSNTNSGDIINYKGGYADFWLLKTDSNFNIIWSRNFGSSNKDCALIYTEQKKLMVFSENQIIIGTRLYPPSSFPDGDVECGRYDYNQSLGTQYTDAWIVAFDLTTSLELQKSDIGNSFVIFPNPSSNEITIKNKYPLNKRLRVNIYDGTGKIVKEIYYTDDEELKINVNELSDGIYSISIIRNKKLLYSQKIIIKK